MKNLCDEEKLSFEKRALSLLDRCESIPLASVNKEGYPRICEMEIVKANGFREIYFTAAKNSVKIEHFLANNKASVSFHGDDDSVSLIGNIEIIEDMETKRDIWKGEHEMRFVEENGEPKYCILRFRAIEGRFLVDGMKRTYIYKDDC